MNTESDGATQMPPASTHLESDCWNHIGVAGDRSCAELEQHVHCRNCPVYSNAGRRLLDRPVADDYLSAATAALSRAVDHDRCQRESVVLFRLAGEWFAMSTELCREVVEFRTIHRVPHRSDGVFLGLINIRGQLQLCISLTEFLGIEVEAKASQAVSHIVYQRVIAFDKDGECWVFLADEVFGIYDIRPQDLAEPPVTVGAAASSFTRSLFQWQGRDVALLDDVSLFAGLRSKVL